jgi:hypothetical protein
MECTIQGCATPARRHGYCPAHLARFYRHGDPLGGGLPRGLPREAYYWAKVTRGDPDECWPWTGATNRKGYGTFAVGRGKTQAAHVYGYVLAYGPVPKGKQVDHTCHNGSGCTLGNDCPHRACQNPGHLEAVTQGTNALRGESVTAVNARKTHCKWGHELTEENSYGYNGRRQCITCSRLGARGLHPRQHLRPASR